MILRRTSKPRRHDPDAGLGNKGGAIGLQPAAAALCRSGRESCSDRSAQHAAGPRPGVGLLFLRVFA